MSLMFNKYNTPLFIAMAISIVILIGVLLMVTVSKPYKDRCKVFYGEDHAQMASQLDFCINKQGEIKPSPDNQ